MQLGPSKNAGARSGAQGKKLEDDEYTRGNPVEGHSGKETSIDRKIMDQEDALGQASKDLSLDSLTISGSGLPRRRGFGTLGKRVSLKTNYFKLDIDTTKSIYRYKVDVDSDRKRRAPSHQSQNDTGGKRTTRVAYGNLFEEKDFQALDFGIATDYSKTILTAEKLQLGPSGSKTYRVSYREAEETTLRQRPITYTFTLSFVGTVATSELVRYLASTVSDPSDFAGKDETIQALNIVISRTPNFNPLVFQSGGNRFYHYPQNINDYLDLTKGLIAVRGYYASVRTSTLRTLLNLNSTCSPFYPSISMWNLMNLHSRFIESQWEACERFIEKLRVKTTYLKGANEAVDVRIKTICGLSQKFEERTNPDTKRTVTSGNPQVDHGNAFQIKFECQEYPGGPISVADYFLKKHGKRLQHPEAFVLNCGTVFRPIWIPSELCTVMPGQAYRGLLSEQQTTNMLSIASRPPAENARRIIGKGQEVMGLKHQNPTLDAFGVTVGKDMILVAGRILEPPPILYKDKRKLVPTGASWNMISKQVTTSGDMDKWSILTLGKATYSPDHFRKFTGAVRSTGIRSSQFVRPEGAKEGTAYHVEFTISARDNENLLASKIRKIFDAGVTMLFVILPSFSAALYGRVKYWSEVKAGIRTSCALVGNLNKGAPYYANIALKLNLKCGGVNHVIDPQSFGFLTKQTTMIVGIDVTHPAPKSMEGTPSIAAVVASEDTTYTRYPGSIRCQASKVEIVQNIDIMMRERLDHWKEKNRRLPERILVYRDGVSEGQYRSLLMSEPDKTGKYRISELDGIRKACEERYRPGPMPKITIVVVGKRHHTRFYPTQEVDADMSSKGNCKNGTIVDRGVTMEKGFDFFLQAHSALQGTARPAHYVVIHDEMGWSADDIQETTHNLSYLYGRATKAVSICPPAYYADILCERGRAYLADHLAQQPRGKVFDPNEAPFYTQGVATRLKNQFFYI